jgi:hypothetical protein
MSGKRDPAQFIRCSTAWAHIQFLSVFVLIPC